jgi:hypothetical protein
MLSNSKNELMLIIIQQGMFVCLFVFYKMDIMKDNDVDRNIMNKIDRYIYILHIYIYT